jgi:hypothetical protein
MDQQGTGSHPFHSTWKNAGCHWALIPPYMNLNGFLFMAVLH